MKNLSNRRIIRPSEIQGIYGISRSTVYRQIQQNKFPARVQLSPNCVGWNKEDLDKHFGLV